ncbi:alpha-L-fucosidase [Flavobacterium algicola]|uniref:alpha-L-fucosidase n=1 Tax=Flavobacterium algicola TaxID=556529 RepID=UPI001EFD3C5D|nr:alpha-L-fucosidase [Flavobacterium algicola]MCG9792854.1 alpha-L-fucosidase [Flavobacterium algicola]
MKRFNTFRRTILLTGLSFVMTNSITAQVNTDGTIDTGDKYADSRLKSEESPEVIAKRLEWWNDARFGLFIHWGIYAQDGCFWNGKDGRSEHMMRNLQIPITEYQKIAAKFNPVQFNADEWAKTAKDAGMKYMVITAKHHDGFAMFDSPSNDYNIVKQTPWKRDPIKELAAACTKEDLKFGVYYSLGRDWHDPDCNSKDGWRSNVWDFPEEAKKDYSKYFERKVKSQIKELMKQYHPAILWFDTPELITLDQSRELLALIHSIDPKCIVNQRIGNRLGDYAVKEQKIPGNGEPDPWETCMTLNGAWGYHKTDTNWKSSDSLVHSLIDIASKGGNLLLNVGPTGEGIIPALSVSRLGEVGDWLKVNGEAIYGTTSSPFGKMDWGRCTKKEENGNTILYFSVFERPVNGKIVLPKFSNEIKKVSLLANGKVLKKESKKEGVVVEIPPINSDEIVAIVKLELKGILKL